MLVFQMASLGLAQISMKPLWTRISSHLEPSTSFSNPWLYHSAVALMPNTAVQLYVPSSGADGGEGVGVGIAGGMGCSPGVGLGVAAASEVIVTVGGVGVGVRVPVGGAVTGGVTGVPVPPPEPGSLPDGAIWAAQ